MTRFRAALLVLAVAAPAPAADPVALLKYVPPQANTVAVVNVAAILGSDRAKAEGWDKMDQTEYLAGAVPVHPAVERLLTARTFDPHSPGHGPMLAVAPFRKEYDLAKIAATVGGEMTTVAGGPAVLTPSGAYYVPLDKTTIGAAWTENRQDVARWLRFADKANGSQLSKYLNTAVATLADRHHIAFAVDTEELFTNAQARAAVAGTKALEGDPKQAAMVEDFIAGLRGVTFVADVTTDGVKAQVRLASGSPNRPDPTAVKAFVVGALERVGAALDDLPTATAAADGSVVSLSFKVTDPELARIMSLILPPVPSAAEAVAVAPAGFTPEATKKYLTAVNRIVDDLFAKSKRADDYAKTAVWHDTAANRLGTLSVVNVDPVAVQYAAGTAGRLRAIADSLRGVPLQAAQLDAQAYVYTVRPRTTVWTPAGIRLNPWAYYGPTNTDTNIPKIRQQQMELVKQDVEKRAELWGQITRLRSDTRRQMLEKYMFDMDAKK